MSITKDIQDTKVKEELKLGCHDVTDPKKVPKD